MITPEALKKKALRHWTDGRFLKAWLAGETLFPLEIPLSPPSGSQISHHFEKVRLWIQALESASKEKTGIGYQVAYRAVNHRLLGHQQIPDRIRFETETDWLGYIGKKRDYDRFRQITEKTRAALPALTSFLQEKPLVALGQAATWDRLLAVCNWFTAHPRPKLYIRQLDIPGVETKFIEGNKKILAELLDRVLDDSAVDQTVAGLSGHGFERRFGLYYDSPGVRLRILDPLLAPGGLTDLTLPAVDLAARDFGARTVFVTENKINGLCFPQVPCALVIFGLGYGIEMLAEVGWLKEKRIVYWGDIDTHGFAILSRIRGYFPHTESLLMDRDTLETHRDLWGQEDEKKRFLGALSNLTEPEQALFSDLKTDRLGPAVRLEQERIGFSCLVTAL